MDGEGQAWILANEILKQISRFSIVFAWFFNRISNGFSSMAKAERGFFANAFLMRISRFSWCEIVYHFSCSNYRVAKLFSIFRRISFSSCHQKKIKRSFPLLVFSNFKIFQTLHPICKSQEFDTGF